MRRHLADCPECQAEYTSFVGVKRIMDIGLVGAPMPEPAPPKKRFPAVKKRFPALKPLRRRLVLGTAGGLAVLALLGGGYAMGQHRTPARAPASTALPAVTQSGVTAQISYESRGWGTWVDAKMSGAPTHTVCTLFVYDKQQNKFQLSSWKSVGKQIDIPAATNLTPDQIDHFEVRVDDHGYDISVPMGS
ncbi:hypothetical protein GCM10009839_03700 [Catenulispora yoronensis]|uniref:Zinc-finger domain-containing protein n=1 Tax=Catenulispora yoronensis TaxID=450799 RepID=A0ABP5EZG4_9ACTN